LEKADVGEHDGKVQLTIKESVTSVKKIQQGVGYTEVADAGEEQENLEADTESEQAAADGGQTAADAPPDDAEGPTAAARQIWHVINDAGGRLERGKVLAKAAEQHDMDPETAASKLEKACQTGIVDQPQEDVFRAIQ
jgi:hypothetical protein